MTTVAVCAHGFHPRACHHCRGAAPTVVRRDVWDTGWANLALLLSAYALGGVLALAMYLFL